MVAKKTTPAAKADATEAKAPRKPRTPKPVTDLATATAALKTAERKAQKAAENKAEAVQADADAYAALQTARAAVERFYREAMGLPAQDETPDVPEADSGEPDDGYEASGVYGADS